MQTLLVDKELQPEKIIRELRAVENDLIVYVSILDEHSNLLLKYTYSVVSFAPLKLDYFALQYHLFMIWCS